MLALTIILALTDVVLIAALIWIVRYHKYIKRLLEEINNQLRDCRYDIRRIRDRLDDMYRKLK